MIHDPELRSLLEAERKRARNEHDGLPSNPAVVDKRSELQQRLAELNHLLEATPPAHEAARRDPRLRFYVILLAVALLVLVAIWAAVLLRHDAQLHAIDANLNQLLDVFRQRGLRPE